MFDCERICLNDAMYLVCLLNVLLVGNLNDCKLG